jgi:Family of unknown function (DUF5856)
MYLSWREAMHQELTIELVPKNPISGTDIVKDGIVIEAPTGETELPQRTVGDFILFLFDARSVAHALHLRTDSHAEHSALNDFYDALPDLVDSLAESYQGLCGVIQYGGSQGYSIPASSME